MRLLDRIYKSAKGSLGYIGAQPRGVDAKEAFVRFAGVVWVEACGLVDGEGGRESTSTNATTVAMETSDRKKSESFGQELWNSQWYLRSWVTQEVVLPDVMIYLFGDEDSAITFPVDLMAGLVHHQVQVPVWLIYRRRDEAWQRSKNTVDRLEHAASTRQVTNMPSWVPDWSFQPRLPLDSRLYRAAGSTKCTARLFPCGQKIITKVLLFGQITLPGAQVSYPDYEIINNTFNASNHPHSVTLVLDAITTRFYKLAHQQWGRNPGRNPDDPLDQIISRTLTADRRYGDRRATDADVSSYHAFKATYPRDFSGKYHSGAEAAPFCSFLAMTMHCQRGRSICLTQAGYLAVCPGDVRKGDWLAILPGGNLPFVLRRKGEVEFEVVGHAYVHGAMDGEVLIRLGLVMDKGQDELFESVVELV